MSLLLGPEKGLEGRLVEACQGVVWWRQGQEKEVVQGKGQGQGEQRRVHGQGHLRQACEGSSDLQAYHLERLG